MHSQRAFADAAADTMATLLGRVGVELDHLALSVDELQVRLSPLLVDVMTADNAMTADIQRLDLIAQSLASLSTFVHGLGCGAEAQPAVDAHQLARALPLRDLGDRLRGEERVEEVDDFELF